MLTERDEWKCKKKDEHFLFVEDQEQVFFTLCCGDNMESKYYWQ